MSENRSPPGNTHDTPDGYWLACIAQRQSRPEATPPPNAEIVLKGTVPATNLLALGTKTPEVKKYPRSPVDSFWLKQAETFPQNRAIKDNSSWVAGVTQTDARVSIPTGVMYTVIVDDGHRHHVVWGIRNMSLSGVLLDMDVSHMREASAVDFLLRYKHRGRPHDFRIPAKVVRTQLNGLALRFNYHDTNIYNALVNLLYTP